MRPDRQTAIGALQNMGWTATRKKVGSKPAWEFRRPDTGGLWDTFTVRQGDLSMDIVVNKALQYGDAPDLAREIQAAKEAWIRSRFVGILSRADTIT